MKEAIIK